MKIENKNRIENFEEEIRLEIRNKTFLNETTLNKYVKWHALSLINFVDCRFEEIDFLGIPINVCKFKNSEFNHFSFRKCQISKCTFENCRIMNSDLTRAEFDDSSFINCEFLKSELAASDFWSCEFSETTFKNSRFDVIVARDIKCWQSNQLIKIKKSSNFANILKDLNLASSKG